MVPFYQVAVTERKWLSAQTFELKIEKPADFSHLAGQKILCSWGEYQREYSLACSSDTSELVLCVRLVKDGLLTNYLSEVEIGTLISISDAYGFFSHQKGKNVFVATGTGIAPFVAFAQEGAQDFLLLHGVADTEELYYQDLFRQSAGQYVPCISQEKKKGAEVQGYSGRVTEYLATELRRDTYNFYLCGNGAMIRDAIRIIDDCFGESRIFSETFFSLENG